MAQFSMAVTCRSGYTEEFVCLTEELKVLNEYFISIDEMYVHDAYSG